MFRAVVVSVAVAVALALPTTAEAQQVDVPSGYGFCGWSDFSGGWTFEQPDGAYLALFSRRMTCRTARRKYRRVRHEQRPPYRPRLTGYRCKVLEDGYEYQDVRCSKKGRPRVSLRWQTGA